MAISVADNFNYQGGKPLDARMKYSTVNEMVGTAASVLYDGCFAYVAATKKYYSYDSTNDIDQTLGKWREYSPGGSVDVDDNPTQGSTNPVSSGGVYTSLSNKVDKVSGKGLSTNDYDNTEKGKVTSAKNHADINNGSNPHNTTFDNLAVKPEKAALSDLTITDPGYKAYGEIIDLTGKEYIVGDYILADGKKQPLYQKTIHIAELPAKGGPIGSFGLGVANVDFAYVVSAFSRYALGGDEYSFDIPFPWAGSVNAAATIYFKYDTSDTTMNFKIGTEADIGGRPATVTVRYTKTTDTPS